MTNHPHADLGVECQRLDLKLAGRMPATARSRIWHSISSILSHGPQSPSGASGDTCLALGYVQSGKTTSITALIAAAKDADYRVVVALLGSTNLLLSQNRERLEKDLDLGDREDYVWVIESNPSGTSATKRLQDWIDRGRTVVVPLLKHAGRIDAAAECLEHLPIGTPVIVIDDEADQASLNTAGEAAESKTYAAVKKLRSSVPAHLYVQYTATPYAPLLLDAENLLSPQYVEFLAPGPGYTGGKEFFIDFADRVIRDVPALEEQASKTPPLQLPSSLIAALGSFIAGAALLLAADPAGSPVSMLVHSTARNDVQARYQFLTQRMLGAWRREGNDAELADMLPQAIRLEREKLVSRGAADVDDATFLDRVRFVLRESTVWLVNTASALDKVDWTVAPIHILIGGNKLDRGYTVEGLTVTYMNRPASDQVDTLEQRARAYGYRRDQLPYCQFFASRRTTRALREIVYTEYDLRSRLRDHVDAGGSVHSWARDIGLLMPAGMRPTRRNVVAALSSSPSGWQSMRLPDLDQDARNHNRDLVAAIGLLDADPVPYGRLRLRTTRLPVSAVVEGLLRPWALHTYSPTWRHSEILDVLERKPQNADVAVILMENNGSPRIREWDPTTGFVNLFQGRDTAHREGSAYYPGDRNIPNLDEDSSALVVQVHRVLIKGLESIGEVLAPAVHLGGGSIVRKQEV